MKTQCLLVRVLTSPVLYKLKQTTEPKYPDILLLAINKVGIMAIDPQTKVNSFLFVRITSYAPLPLQ